MATHNSTYYKPATVARTAADDKLEPAQNGVMRVFYGKMTASAQTLAQDDFVNMFDLPAGCTPCFYKLAYGAFGASVTLDIGWSGDENALESALDVSSAGALNWTAVDDSTPLTAAKTLQAHFEGANPADDQSLEVWLLALVSL